MQKGRGRVSKGARPGKRANKETRGEESIVRNGERKEIGFLKKKKKKGRRGGKTGRSLPPQTGFSSCRIIGKKGVGEWRV